MAPCPSSWRTRSVRAVAPGVLRTRGGRRPGSLGHLPGTLRADFGWRGLAEGLEREGVRFCYTDFHLATRINFLSGEAVICSAKLGPSRRSTSCRTASGWSRRRKPPSWRSTRTRRIGWGSGSRLSASLRAAGFHEARSAPAVPQGRARGAVSPGAPSSPVTVSPPAGTSTSPSSVDLAREGRPAGRFLDRLAPRQTLGDEPREESLELLGGTVLTSGSVPRPRPTPRERSRLSLRPARPGAPAARPDAPVRTPRAAGRFPQRKASRSPRTLARSARQPTTRTGDHRRRGFAQVAQRLELTPARLGFGGRKPRTGSGVGSRRPRGGHRSARPGTGTTGRPSARASRTSGSRGRRSRSAGIGDEGDVAAARSASRIRTPFQRSLCSK